MNCRGCEGATETVFVMAPIPVAGDFKATREEAVNAERFPLEWRRCVDCGLVNVWPDMEPDWKNYSYRASDVPALRRHHRKFAQWLADRFDPRVHIEIGGNDGVLRRYLPWGWRSINVDPSDVWEGPGLNEPWNMEAARKVPRADLITASNSMAHFSGISEAFAAVRHALRSDGAFVMEVHDLDATLWTNQWDTIYHEHAVEWDMDSLRNVGRLHGLRLERLERVELHGGLLRATFRPDMPHRAYRPFGRDFGRLQAAYDDARPPELPDGSAAYGASARATVYTDHVRPNIDYVIDDSPRRQGRFMPGTGLPIHGPEYFGTPPAVLITARGHERDIIERNSGYRGKWVTIPMNARQPDWVEAFG